MPWNGEGVRALYASVDSNDMEQSIPCRVPNSKRDLDMFCAGLEAALTKPGNFYEMRIRFQRKMCNDLLRSCGGGTLAAYFHRRGLLSEGSR